MPRLESVYPISGEDVTALPVKHLDEAVAFYETILGFTLLRRDATTAQVQRDKVQLGLVRTDDHEPGKAGSMAFAVDDLDLMHQELDMSGAKPGVFGTDKWGGKQYRTFFVREDTNGYCYCYYCPLPHE